MSKRYWETSDFWKDAGEKIVTSFLQGCIGLMVVDAATPLSFDWKQILLTGGVMSALSSLKALVGSQIRDGKSVSPTGLL